MYSRSLKHIKRTTTYTERLNPIQPTLLSTNYLPLITITTPNISNDFNIEYNAAHLQKIDHMIHDLFNIDVLQSALHMHSTLAMIVKQVRANQ